MFTKPDKKWLKENFATKNDLKNELAPIKNDIRSIKKTSVQIRKDLEMAVGELDKDRDTLEKRVSSIENQRVLSSSVS